MSSSATSGSTSGVSINSKARRFERGSGRGIPKHCRCGERSFITTSETTQNPGQLFCCCPYGSKEDKYHLFKWTDVAMVEEMEEVEAVVGKMQVDMEKLEKGLACELGTLACETRTCEAVVNSYRSEIDGMKELIKRNEKEIEEIKAILSLCEKEMHELRGLKNLFVCGLVLVVAYSCKIKGIV